MMAFSALQSRITQMMSRMLQAGMGEAVLIFGRETKTDASGTAIARARVQQGSLTGYVLVLTGGTEQQAQEGERVIARYEVYYVNSSSDPVNETNYSQHQAQLPRRHGLTFLRIANCEIVGPYAKLELAFGGTNDPAGNLK